MSLALSQGQNVSLSKVVPGAWSIQIGVGWGSTSFEIDVSAFLLSSSGRVRSDGDFIFYNQPASNDGSVTLMDAPAGSGDFKMIGVDLSRIASDISKVVVTITIDQGVERGQSFAQLPQVHVRLTANGSEGARYSIQTSGMSETAITAAELYRHNSEWKLRAVGQGFSGGLEPLARSFGVDISGESVPATAVFPPPDFSAEPVKSPVPEPVPDTPAPLANPPVPVAKAPADPITVDFTPVPPPSPNPPPSPGDMTWQRFVSDGQDPSIVRKVWERVMTLLVPGETIVYMAVQKGQVLNFSPACVCLTSRRVIVFKPQLLGGMSFEDFKWIDVQDVQITEGIRRSTVKMVRNNNQTFQMNELPKDQARTLYSLAQNRDSFYQEYGRPAAPAVSGDPANDPVKALQQLKELYDAGILSQSEYETKRQAIVSRL